MPEMVTGHCYKCYGSGLIRKRDMIGSVRGVLCTFCKGIGRRRMIAGSGEHRMSLKIGAIGLGPGIRKGHSAYAAAGSKRLGRK